MREIFSLLRGVSRPRLTHHSRGVRRPRSKAPLRGLTQFGFSLALVQLLVRAISAQNVSIELTPITYPIVLPDSGGSFDYLLTVTNQGGTPITATVWCMATLPNGSSWGPVVGPTTQTLAAGQTQGYYRAQVVPPRAPYGYFMFHAYAGIYPNMIWTQDQFEFQHQAVSGTEQLWVARYNGPGNGPDNGRSLVLDDSGNVYVTGLSYGAATSSDYATIKYDGNGRQVWAARYNCPGDGDDTPLALALDAAGNVYVTGYSYGSALSSDYATIKYDGNGHQVWAARYNGPGDGHDIAQALALDAAGNVYVTGYSYGGETSYDYATIKYDDQGHQVWVARYDGLGKESDLAYSLVLDAAGNVYVTGGSYGSGTSYDYATIKYDGDGGQVWAARYDGPGNYDDLAYSLALDVAGNVYVTGNSYGTETFFDYATIKYDGDGNQVWVARYSGIGYYDDYVYSLALDVAGNVYVTGSSYGGETSFDYATIRYDGDGNQVWVARYNGPGNYYDGAFSLALDAAGDVYVTGYSYPNEIDCDCATIRYDSNGNQVWIARYNGPANNWDVSLSLALDPAGSVHITGYSWGSGTGFDYATIKYSGGNLDNWMPVEATVFGQPLPQECRLEANFPNPFNATTVLRFQLPVASQVKLEIFDVTGRVVGARHASPLPLVDGYRQAGTHELTWDASKMPSGIYFARMQAGDYQGVQKLILLK